jgi:hypothetical protein
MQTDVVPLWLHTACKKMLQTQGKYSYLNQYLKDSFKPSIINLYLHLTVYVTVLNVPVQFRSGF